LVEFGYEFQIGSLQILCNPLVDASVQIRTEVVLPVARLSFADERMPFVGESIVMLTDAFLEKMSTLT
jgi:hypothetical protein